MRTFSEHFQEQLLDTKIGMLAYMFAYHKLSAAHFVDWYVTEGRHLPEDQLMMVLFENDPAAAQQQPAQPPPLPNQQQQPQGMMGRLGNMVGSAGRWMYNNPYKTAAVAGGLLGGPAMVPMAMAGTWLGKKAYNWAKGQMGGQAAPGQATTGQATGSTQPDPQVAQAATQILPQLQQLKTTVANDPKGQQAVDALLQYLGSVQQGAAGQQTTTQQPAGGLAADKATKGN